MLRALRVCIVVLSFVLVTAAGCAAGDPPATETDPEDLGGGGGWEGSNCMGANYGITLIGEDDQLVTVRQSTAIGVVVDEIQLASQRNDDDGLEVMVDGLDRFLAVGLRNWQHKIAEVLLPDEHWVTSLDRVTDERGRGHYNILGVFSPCQPVIGSLSPAVARTLAMFLYALSQMASCPDADAAEADGNFVSVRVRLQASRVLAGQLPAAPPSPTLAELFASAGARPIAPGATPDPTMTCILRGPPEPRYPVPEPVEPVVVTTTPDVDVDVLPLPPALPPPLPPPLPPIDAPRASYHIAATKGPCLVEARVEAVVTTVPRFHPTLPSGPAGEPVAFAGEPVVQSAGALGAASPVRHFLADNHVGTIDEVHGSSTCDDPSYGPYGSRWNPCPAALARWHFDGAAVKRKAAQLPPDLELALSPFFPAGAVSDGIIVIIPFDAAPRCMAECPPESGPPSGDACE
ncbi:MAG TPA: hypothetical protein VM261_31030 [Kofleriaceae bacterium]|nr:hypothetical protein [Kofleriaceae bacterium]